MNGDKVYELIDESDDESYYTMGLFASLAEAIEAADPDAVEDRDMDFITLAVRERTLGYGGWSRRGKCVWRAIWERDYDFDSREWRLAERSATDL